MTSDLAELARGLSIALLKAEARIAALEAALRPFAVTGIPTEWPGECSLYWHLEAGAKFPYWCFNYHKAYEPAGPTVEDYRRAGEAMKEAK